MYSDDSHTNICQGTGSVGAHIIFLADNKGLCCPLAWKSNKIKRVVRSTLAAEALSLQEGVEEAVYTNHLIQEMLCADIPIMAYVDNKGVVEAVKSTKMVDDKRLRLDIAALKESLENKELHSVHWCPGDQQLADVMTKRGVNSYKIMAVLCSGTF